MFVNQKQVSWLQFAVLFIYIYNDFYSLENELGMTTVVSSPNKYMIEQEQCSAVRYGVGA
jgi:hypothetical protein